MLKIKMFSGPSVISGGRAMQGIRVVGLLVGISYANRPVIDLTIDWSVDDVVLTPAELVFRFC